MRTKKIFTVAVIFIAFISTISAQELTNSIHFKAGSVIIDKSSHDELLEIADIMQALPDYEFLIAGHVDSSKSRESGIIISKKRADAVAEFLIDAGVDRKQIESVGLGNTKPKFNNFKSTGRSKNRRVEISLKGSEEAVEGSTIEYDDSAVDANFDIKQIAQQYDIPVKLLKEWNSISGKLSFLGGKNNQLNKNIHFRSGSIDISNSSQKLLSRIGDFMLKYPNTQFTLGGHTDSLGSDAYNKEVSQGRADAVAEFLRKLGIKPKNLKVVAFGYTKPKFINKNTWGKTQLNRRVEIVFDALSKYNEKQKSLIERAMSRDLDEFDLANKETVYHIVLMKETLFSISQKYNVNIKNLRKWNHLDEGNAIYAKQTLVLYIDK